MKHTLGKIFFLCLHILWLQASDFTHNVQVDNSHPYIKEATLVTVEVNQTNHDIVLLFDFNILQSPDYTFQRVDIQEVNAYHAVQIRYTYLVYPLKSGKVSVAFSLTQKATTDESVAYSFSGDRDNVKGLVTKNTNINLSPIVLEVKPLPTGTQLVGDFSLDYRVNKHEAEAFEPLPIQVTIEGKGYPPVIQTLLPKEGNFTRFTESPLVDSSSTTQGTRSRVTYAMALSSDTSFTLPVLAIKAYNPLTKKRYDLLIPQQMFNIHPPDMSKLIDKVDSPVALSIDWSWIETFLGYLVVFIAGYLSAWSWRWQTGAMKQIHPLKEKIHGAKTHRQLLQILLSQEKKCFSRSIQKLENVRYKEKVISLQKIKKEALENVQ